MNDVFISYASDDREWAEKLAADLSKANLKVFFDRESLKLGDDWEEKINQALRQSRNLVCFWSANAFKSPWVQTELGAFRAKMSGGDGIDLKLFIVPLDNQVNAFTKLQQFDSPALKTAYASTGASAVPEHDWKQFVETLKTGIKTKAASLQVPVALLTIDDSALPFSQQNLNRFSMQLGLTPEQINQRYGKTRKDWKPFTGDANTIETHLAHSRDDINSWLRESPDTCEDEMEWDFPDDRFWSDTDLRAVREFAGRMESGQAGLIIIDPVATQFPEIQIRLSEFRRCLKLGNVAIVAPHPTPATQQDANFRQFVFQYTAALLNDYVAPRPIPDSPMFARFGIGVDEMSEMRRLLQRSIGDVLSRRDSRSNKTVTMIRNHA